MFTECMAVKLLKDKDTQIIGAINKFNPDAVMPTVKRKRDSKVKVQNKEVDDAASLSDTSDNYFFNTNPYFYKLRKRLRK